MEDYQTMYSIICRAASKAIDASPEKAKQLLQNALYEAEDVYIQTCGDSEEAPELHPQI